MPNDDDEPTPTKGFSTAAEQSRALSTRDSDFAFSRPVTEGPSVKAGVSPTGNVTTTYDQSTGRKLYHGL